MEDNKKAKKIDNESFRLKSIENFFSEPEPVKEIADKSKSLERKKWIKVNSVVMLLVLIVSMAGYYFWNKNRKTEETKKSEMTAEESVLKDTKEIVDTIGKFLELPVGEDPTMATVTDVEKVKGQSFFSNAQNGDKVLIYMEAKKAILFRPSSGKVIEVAPLSDANNQVQPTEKTSEVQIEPVKPAQEEIQTQTQKARVVVYNGTKIKGLAKGIQDKISSLEGLEITGTDNAIGIFDKTIVVDLNGENSELVAKIAETLGAEIADGLPSDETKPDADILVIGGEK